MSIVEQGTNNSEPAWLIQSKFESPILNFAKSSVTAPPTSPYSASVDVTNPIITRGLWHQYGALATGSQGVFAEVVASKVDITNGAELAGDLSDIVGIETPFPKRIGSIARSGKLEEAVVAVPFTIGSDGRRKFFKMNKFQINGGKTSIQWASDINHSCTRNPTNGRAYV